MAKYHIEEIHTFEYRGKKFVFFPLTLEIFTCNDETYGIIKSFYDKYKNCINNSIELCEDEAQMYLEANLLRPIAAFKDCEQSEETNTCVLKPTSDQDRPTVSSIVLEMANDCNLNCLYCYGCGGTYGRKRELMSFDTAKKAVDFLFSNCGDVKHPHVTFFGGEPLLNFGVLKKIVLYCETLEQISDKKFFYSMTTNGTICNDEIARFLYDNNIHVMLSIDGPKNIQDKFRPTNSGKSSFDMVLPNINRFKNVNRGELTARATICSPMFQFVDIKNALLELGFTRVQMSLVDIERTSPLFAGSVEEGKPNERLLEGYMELADDYIKSIKESGISDNKLFHSMLRDLYFKNGKTSACAAGIRSFAIGTDEYIYPCHRYMGMKDYSVGTLSSGVDMDKVQFYRHSNVFEKEGCSNCWIRLLCGGHCSHTSVTQENDIKKAPKVYCESNRKLQEIILWVYSELKEWDETIFTKLFDSNAAQP